MLNKDLTDQVLSLKSVGKAELIDTLLLSLDQPDKTIDELWADEAEKRLLAYRRGTLKTVPAADVLRKQ
jgi:hypothetical protein